MFLPPRFGAAAPRPHHKRPRGEDFVYQSRRFYVGLDDKQNWFDHLLVSRVEQMEIELRKLSQAELRQTPGWLDDLIEDEHEFTPEFERSIQEADRDMAGEKAVRVRESGARERRDASLLRHL